MFIFRHLADWAFTRLFWLCLLGSTAQADVILWEQQPAGFGGWQVISTGEIRSQAIDLTGPAILQSLTLNLTGDPMLFFAANANISVWLDSTPAERQTLIYSGAFRSSWSGLAVDLPKGRSWLSVENLGPGRISWVSPAGSTGGAFTTASGTTSTAGYAGTARGVAVPEPGAVVLLMICCAAGIFYAWRGVDNANQVHGVSRLGLLSVRWC